MSKYDAILRPNIISLKGYKSARSEFSEPAEVYIDANENPYDFSRNRYPDPYQGVLKGVISKHTGEDADRLFITNGSDDCIDILTRAFCNPGIDSIYYFLPGFSMYKFAADVNDVAVHTFPLNEDFTLDVDGFIANIPKNCKIIWITSPNNPTGNSIPEADILKIYNSFDGIIAVDEAYIDFSAHGSMNTHHELDRMVVLQTMSKGWGSAGLRVGVAFMDPELVHILNKVKLPYNMNELTQEMAIDLFENPQQKNESIKDILSEKPRIEKVLNNVDSVLKVYPSDANFFLVKFEDANEMYQYLLKNKIVVRNQTSNPGAENCLRISIGTKTENDQLINALKSYK